MPRVPLRNDPKYEVVELHGHVDPPLADGILIHAQDELERRFDELAVDERS
jgi:hypothetical protein